MLKNFLIVIFLLFLYPSKPPIRHSIRLKWNTCFENENWNYVQTGFLWNLSYLGAHLDSGTLEKMIVRESDSIHFQLNLDYAGFNPLALNKLNVILDTLKQSKEYKMNGSIDMGRFIMITQNSSWHYYEITGVYKNLRDFKKQYKMEDSPRYLVSSSGVTKEKRVISIHIGDSWSDIAFMAEVGNIEAETGEIIPTEIEVFDVMQNGQLRFAVYGSDGELKPGSDVKHSIAGKPSKCMWCHESAVQPLFYGEFDNPGYITSKEFLAYVEKAMLIIKNYRRTLNTEIDYNNTHQHTYSELNYIGFMNPTIKRISNELETDLKNIQSKVDDLRSYTFVSFPFYYQKYPVFMDYPGLKYRSQVDSVFGHSNLQVPEDALETNLREPNYFE